jgi:hypothetical protein
MPKPGRAIVLQTRPAPNQLEHTSCCRPLISATQNSPLTPTPAYVHPPTRACDAIRASSTSTVAVSAQLQSVLCMLCSCVNSNAGSNMGINSHLLATSLWSPRHTKHSPAIRYGRHERATSTAVAPKGVAPQSRCSWLHSVLHLDADLHCIHACRTHL